MGNNVFEFSCVQNTVLNEASEKNTTVLNHSVCFALLKIGLNIFGGDTLQICVLWA